MANENEGVAINEVGEVSRYLNHVTNTSPSNLKDNF